VNSKEHLSWQCDEHTSSDLYSRRFKGEVGRLIIERQNTLLLSLLGDIRGRTVLDVGAGHGQLVGALLGAGARVTVYGSSGEALKRLAPHHIRCVTGPLSPLPFGDVAFDIVVSFRTFPHVPDWGVFLTELCRVARCAVAFDFVTQDVITIFKPLVFRLKMQKEPGTRDYTLQKKRDIQHKALELGFHWKAAEGQFLLPLVVHRTVGKPLLMPVEHLARLIGVTRLYGGPVIAVLERVSRAPGGG
jgi:SAM-dependent methyltransferase